MTDELSSESADEPPEAPELPDDLSDLHLTAWPFRVVPDESFATVWADRADLKARIDRLVHGWSRQSQSSIHLMWANLGAGKTHTLRNIEQRCLTNEKLRILPLYSILPRQMKSFIQVYRAIVATLDLSSVAKAFANLHGGSARDMREAGAKLFPAIPDAATVLQQLVMASEGQRSLAAEWLRGTRFYRRDLDTLGVTRYVQTDDDAVAVLTGLVSMISAAGRFGRIILMLDECQRLGTFKRAIGSSINTGLQTWVDACPNHLTLIMSFGSGEQSFVEKLISPEIYSRANPRHLILELLSVEDAVTFVTDLLAEFRQEDSPSDLFPFTLPMIEVVISEIVTERGITPRRLMQGFHELLFEADFKISTEGKFEMEPSEAAKFVKDALEKSESSKAE